MFWFIATGYAVSAVGFYLWMIKRAVLHDESDALQVTLNDTKELERNNKETKQTLDESSGEDRKIA